MNTNPAAKTILCYGDSNTFGQRSDDVTKGRWPVDTRWTGQLQRMLGGDYCVIEEGLSSRTTNIDYAKKPGRNGRAYLLPCLQSHNPIDTVVLMLGTNDFKDEFARDAQDIAAAVEELITDCKQYAHRDHFKHLYSAKYSDESAQKSLHLASHLEQVAQSNGCKFFDAASVATAGDDGVHLRKESHTALAEALYTILHAN